LTVADRKKCSAGRFFVGYNASHPQQQTRMPEHNARFSLFRTAKLLGVFFAIPLSVWMVLMAYDGITTYLAGQAEDAKLPRDALRPSDDFYQVMHGRFRVAAKDIGVIQMYEGGALLVAAQRFVKSKDDVIARTRSTTWQGRDTAAWSLFKKVGEPYFTEHITWCIRIKPQPGQEGLYAYTLWQISQLEFAGRLGLAKPPPELRLTPETALNYIKIDDKKELRIPIVTSWRGPSENNLQSHAWRISPHSSLCSPRSKN
jgi:hypothetical protein